MPPAPSRSTTWKCSRVRPVRSGSGGLRLPPVSSPDGGETRGARATARKNVSCATLPELSSLPPLSPVTVSSHQLPLARHRPQPLGHQLEPLPQPGRLSLEGSLVFDALGPVRRLGHDDRDLAPLELPVHAQHEQLAVLLGQLVAQPL